MIRNIIILLSVTFLCTCSLYSQVNKDTNSVSSQFQKSYWVEFGLGWGGQGMGGQISASFEIKTRLILSVGFDAVSSNVIFGTSNYTDAESYSIKVGKVKKFNGGLISFSFGPSFVHVAEFTRTGTFFIFFGTGETEEFNVIGFSGRASILFGIKFISLGLSPFFNLNGKYSYGGLTINLGLGKILYKSL